MKSTSVRGTPVNHIGGASNNREGIAPGAPKGSDGQTTMEQYRGTGMSTAQGDGTPYNSQAGNEAESRRAASQHRYGVSPGAGGVDYNDPAANGSGVVFDGATRQNGYAAKPAPSLDSPVSRDAPFFDGRTVEQENKAHLGTGNESGRDGLVSGGGVMSRE